MGGKKRKPSSSNRRGMVAIALIVMVLLAGLMGLAFYNDILHLVSS